MRTNYLYCGIIGIFLGLSSACVNVDATRFDKTANFASVPTDTVQIFLDPREVTQPYDRIALLEANADGDLTTEKDFIESFRRKAAKLGANAIILEPGLEPGPLVKTAQVLLGAEYTRYRHATAIRLR